MLLILRADFCKSVSIFTKLTLKSAKTSSKTKASHTSAFFFFVVVPSLGIIALNCQHSLEIERAQESFPDWPVLPGSRGEGNELKKKN